MTQPSQKLLVADLQDAGAHYLATRAAGDEFHDFSGPHEMPKIELVYQLDTAIEIKAGDPDKLQAVRRNVSEGKYDATRAERDEWKAGDEGQAALRELGGHA